MLTLSATWPNRQKALRVPLVSMLAHVWRKLCCSFSDASDDLCQALASVAHRLCTQFVHPSALAPLLVCHLITLDKNPGVRPIGICEVPRRILSKAILFILKSDIQEAAGLNQLCGGQVAGIEAAVHSVRQLFNNENSEAMLLVDANNAFNSLNRASALMNMSTICPPISTVLMNIYRESSDLILGTCTLQSQQGTTQGDPLAMPFYALATRLLIDALDKGLPDLRQIWYADDATAVGKLCDLKRWWEKLSMIGPSFGYYVNLSKTWLVINEKCVSAASYLFGESNVNITTEGRPILGSPIGKPEFISNFVDRKVNQWIREIEKLTEVADSQPHAA